MTGSLPVALAAFVCDISRGPYRPCHGWFRGPHSCEVVISLGIKKT